MAAEEEHEEPEEHGESAPLWIISFADLSVLLMGFFVILSLGNTKDPRLDPEYAKMLAAIREAFGYIPPADSTDPIDLALIKDILHLKLGKPSGQPAEARTEVKGASGQYDTVTTIREGAKLVIGSKVMFDKDSSVLKPDQKPALVHLLKELAGHMNVFVVKGHTSMDEEYRLRGKGRDLAYERARVVYDALIAMGISPLSLRAQSCHDYEPLKEGMYGENAWAANRRVEIMATEALVSDYRGQKNDETIDIERRVKPKSLKETFATPLDELEPTDEEVSKSGAPAGGHGATSPKGKAPAGHATEPAGAH